jgi:ABC-type lipoprotein export system ATPase subunit
MTPAVDMRDAFRIFGAGASASVALQGLSLSVKPGEIVAVLGPSGSGKTTLLRAAAGLASLSAGSVHVFGADVGRMRGAELRAFGAATFGFLDQHYARALSPDLTVRRTVSLGLELRGSPPGEARRAADALLDRVGLLERANARPAELSGGEQQRVGVCAAVAHRPRLLLVDEPAGELDASNAAVIYALLADLAHEARAAALIVSHDPEAATIADRLVRVRDGRIVSQEAPGGTPSLVASKGGWVRLPLDGRTSRLVGVEQREGAFVLRPTGGVTAARTPPPAHASAAAEPIAELRGVRKSYRSNGAGRTVVDGLDLTARRGTLTALVGRSGAGKTTLVHLLAGLERPDSGEALVGGQSLRGRSRSELAALRRATIALVTQEPGLVPHLSARENVLLSLSLGDGAVDAARADEALEAVGLADRAGRRAASLSAGERARVAIARALAGERPLLLADEPTARLDEDSAAEVGRLLAEAARSHGRAVVCATHDPAVIELADEIVRLERR